MANTKPSMGSTLPGQPSVLPDPTAGGLGDTASSFKNHSQDPGKSMPSTNPLKHGPGSNDASNVPGETEPVTQAIFDRRKAEILYGVSPADEDSVVKLEEASTIEHISRPIAVKPKLFDPVKDNPNKSLASRKNKVQGRTNTDHGRNTSKDIKRQAASDAGIRQARPQEFSSPKKILQHDSHLTNVKMPQSPSGPDQYGSSQDKETISDDAHDDPEPNTEMLQQPETRPISHDQLVIEVKGIYAGLVMVEAKCIDVDEKQSIPAQKEALRREPLRNDQWQSLIAIHKQLLHEHHDFLLASQHPSASSNLSKLAAKYSLPARMWHHGIHAFLEGLRHRLPESLEHVSFHLHCLQHDGTPLRDCAYF